MSKKKQRARKPPAQATAALSKGKIPRQDDDFEIELAKAVKEMGGRPQWVTPGLEREPWLLRGYELLGDIPPLPSSRVYSPNTRMYARYEASAWVAANLLWLEEAHQLLVDGRRALALAGRAYENGFPRPPEGIAVPGAMIFDGPAPANIATIQRARDFRYEIDNSIVRASASFQKVAGMLGSYYDISFPRTNQLFRTSQLFSELHRRFPSQDPLERLAVALESDVFRKGQEYRNPWTHGLGSSARAIYGEMPELDEVAVIGPSMVGLKPRPVLLPDALMELTQAFTDLAGEFLRAALDLVEAQPRPFSKDAPFLPRKIQRPMTHRGRDEKGDPTDYTDRFERQSVMRCTALVHDARGSTISVKWKVQNRTVELGRIEVDENGEKRLTVTMEPDPGSASPLGKGHFEWWLDGRLSWRVPFEVIEATLVPGPTVMAQE